jgi:hypothetical protein
MLTDAQLLTLKSAINAETNATFVEYREQGATGAMASWFNEPTSPAFIVWRTSVTQDEIMQNGFDWTRVDNLSVGKARIWEWLFNNESRAFNPSKANVRSGIDATWVGTAADLAQRAAVYVHCKRAAKRGERLFASGTGTDAAPGQLVFEGDITDYDVVRAITQV